VETIGRTRRDHLVEANGINKIARDLKVRATRFERCWAGRGRPIDMFRSSRRRMRFCIAQHWHRQIGLRDGDQPARRKERLRQRGRSMGLPLPGTRVLASQRHQPAFSQMTRTALTVLVLLLVSSATSWAVSNDHVLPPPSLDDEFNSLSLHYRPTGRDIWGLIAPRTPNGRGGPNWFEGDTHMWWTNPFNPKTPVNGLYTAAEGRLRLGLMPTPPAYQTWIDSSAGIHMPFVGTLLYSVQKQRYGYFEIRASVDGVSGLTFQACLETGDVAFPFEIDIILFTSSDGSQHVKFDIATRKGWPSTEVRGIDITQMHTYAIEWTLTTITWYIDGIERWSRPSPGGNYDIYPALWYLLTGADYGGSDTDPSPAQLPAYAHVDWVRNWSSNPYADAARARVSRDLRRD
jgi:hypothetical protein